MRMNSSDNIAAIIPIPSESEEQQAVIKWAEDCVKYSIYSELALLYHVPNGGKRSKSEAARLKREGVKAGVPDLVLPVPRGVYHGLYIEMKTDIGKTSKEQDEWLEALREQGYYATDCHGAKSAIRVLEWYLKSRRA